MNQIKTLLEKYAQLSIEVGLNLNKGQLCVINAPIDSQDFVHLLVKEAYKKGASEVLVKWVDDYLTHEYFLNAPNESLDNVPSWIIEQFKMIVEKNACCLSITSPIPDIMEDINPMRQQRFSKARKNALAFYYEHMMSSRSQWCVIAYPNKLWAKEVFPKLSKKEAYDELMKQILFASRVKEGNDPVDEWKKHIASLSKKCKVLNDYQFKALHFENKLGTNITVGLVKNHIWGGGAEEATNNQTVFAPNIPSEEVFTMPNRKDVNGIVVSSKPLIYQDKVIDHFQLEFRDGKVVNYKAEVGESVLKGLLNTDEGASRLGEVALISNETPISQSGILFYDTLFDENASCHLALGRAYPTCVKNGDNLSLEELSEIGYNHSLVHVDFMFGTSDMEVTGIKDSMEKVTIFENGNFIF